MGIGRPAEAASGYLPGGPSQRQQRPPHPQPSQRQMQPSLTMRHQQHVQTQHLQTQVQQAQRGDGDEGLPPLYHACLDGLQQLVNMVAKAKGCMPHVSVDAMRLGGRGGSRREAQ